MVTGNQSLNICGTELIDSRCVVEFRPDDNWEGEYGFDWFRIGDCKEPTIKDLSKLSNNQIKNIAKDGSSHYIKHKIIGKYGPKAANGKLQFSDYDAFLDPDSRRFNGEFATDTMTKEYYWGDKIINEEYKFFCIKGSSRHYIKPCITLFYSYTDQRKTLPNEMLIKLSDGTYDWKYKPEATIKLIINAKNIKRIEFECSKNLIINCDAHKYSDGKVRKTITNIPNTTSKTPNTEHRITIRYEYKSDTPQSVKAFAIHNDNTRTFAGQIMVAKCDPKVIDVCFVNIRSKAGNGGLPGFTAFETQKSNLEKFLAQACIIPKISYRDLDLWNIHRMSYEEQISYLGNLRNDYSNNKYHSSNWGNVFLARGTNEHNSLELGDKLEAIFNKENRDKINDYKIFFLDRPLFYDSSDAEDPDNGGLAGIATNIVSKSATIAEVSKNPSTVCHELLHCIGLFHSFSNKGDYTYEKCSTSNIMDYAFLKENGKEVFNCMQRISLWLWQWRKIRNALNNKPGTKNL